MRRWKCGLVGSKAPDCQSGERGFKSHHFRVRTNDVGNLAEAMLLAKLTKIGYQVSIPFGSGCPYDLVIEKNGLLSTVQVKHGRYRDGVVFFNTYSHTLYAGSQPYSDVVNLFGVWCSTLDKTYLIPNKLAMPTTFSLRVLAPKNNQTSGIVWAKDYEV